MKIPKVLNKINYLLTVMYVCMHLHLLPNRWANLNESLQEHRHTYSN